MKYVLFIVNVMEYFVNNITFRWSLHLEERFEPIKLVLKFKPDTFYWNSCTKPEKWVVMYLCARGIGFAYFCDLYFIFEFLRQCGIFAFHFITYVV
jgi:hypothetical protein